MHNNLRITRILKCLGEMGFEHYQPPLVKFFLTETLLRNQLPNVKESVLDYFLYTIRSKCERRKLILFAQMHYKPTSEFVWGPPKAMESRFSYIHNELNTEEVSVSEESSDEDTPAKAEESSLPQEADEERSSKQRRLTKQRSSDSRVKSTNDAKDTKEGSKDRMEAKNRDDFAEEKSNVGEKSPVPENKSNLKENLEEQPEQVEDVVAEGQNMEERGQGNEVPTCPTKGEKIEDDLKMQGDESDATPQKEKESKKNRAVFTRS
ncbi:opioid growth factor receptor-like protein 1 [Scyliorhinus canicula]|uniref:opioid growth factor receptor-like protein 1 n=1 Tax=Scyliorhinus canicula TaxID=7830 RepID=UPI0018F4B604|nr:opioid growth factor receptor-like protein 1 [Scyliorhinus canicula]